MATSPNRSSFPSDRRLLIELDVSAEDPALLAGLNQLYELGLLSDERLRQLGQDRLSCPLPANQMIRQPTAQATAAKVAAQEPAIASIQLTPKAKAKTASPASRAKTSAASQPSRLSRGMTSFMAEVSVLWLLFLGLFLVIVSSAVLAASQWQNFSAVGQYLVLLGYTLAFWGAGQWAGGNPKLRLTAQMVQRVVLLLVPINFWAVDGFALWRSPLGWIVAGTVAIALSWILRQSLKPLLKPASRPKWLLLNSLALSWLHWGWDLAIMPLLASYIAMVGTALNLVYPSEADSEGAEWGDAASRQAPKKSAGSTSERPRLAAQPAEPLSLTLVLLFGALLLPVRAILTAAVPVEQLGLALGLCGAVLLWRDHSATVRSDRSGVSRLGSRLGGLLMLLGWAVSVNLEPPLQAFAISLLALGLLRERLSRRGLPNYLTGLFLVGLQAIWLARRFVPPEWRQVWVDRVVAIAGNSGMPFAVVGVTLFPYLLLFVWLGDRFRYQQQLKLARQALFLSTALGFGLTLFSLGNPLMRALNLSFSAITLGWMARRYGVGQAGGSDVGVGKARKTGSGGWIALFQLLTLGAIFSWAYVIGGEMSSLAWSLLCLGCVGLEWAVSLGLGIGKLPRAWRVSGWVSGLLLAGLGLWLGHLSLLIRWFSSYDPPIVSAALVWWLLPLALLAMAEHPRCLYPKTARVFSLVAIALVQPLGWTSAGPRLAGFGLATLVSGLHSRRWQRLWPAAIATGWSIALSVDLALQLWPEPSLLDKGFVVWGAELGLLCFLWGLLRPQARKLAQLYGRTTKGWSIILAVPLAVSILGLLSHGYYGNFSNSTLADSAIIATGLPCVGLAFALFRLRQNGAALGLGLFGGLNLATVLARLNANSIQSALAFLALGWLSLLISDFWLAKQPTVTHPISPPNKSSTQSKSSNETTARSLELSCHLIPPAYGLVGLFLGHLSFAAYSGLVTLIAAFILLGISRRHRQFNSLGYLGLGTVSIGCFELLLYQLSQASGGNAGDGMVLIGSLSLSLAWGLRSLLPLLHRLLRLDTTGLRQLAAGHWGLGSLIAFVALLMPLSDKGGLLWMGLLAIAGLYALLESRLSQANFRFPWLDAAIVQLLCALGYGIHLLYFWPTLLAWAAAVACPIAMILEVTPWERWGWNSKAGQRWAALLPAILVLLTAWDIAIQAVLIVAVFYAGLAQRRRQVRLGYISLLLADFALLRIFHQLQLSDSLWYGGLLGTNLLFLAQVDPQFNAASQTPSIRNLRHWLRCLGTAIVCLSGLYQAEMGITELSGFSAGLVAIALGLAFVAAGIVLRIRAFLYIGTLTFMMRVLLQAWRYIQTDSLFLWAIGIALGLLLIWIAATFEARRSQITALMDYWLTELEEWD